MNKLHLFKFSLNGYTRHIVASCYANAELLINEKYKCIVNEKTIYKNISWLQLIEEDIKIQQDE